MSGKTSATIKELLAKAKGSNPALLFNKLLAHKLSHNGEEIKKVEFLKEFTALIAENFSEHLNLLKKIVDSLPCSKTFKVRTGYRLAIGLGNPSLIENGFLFHHTYGIPYIPGETLKGLARSVFLISAYESIKDNLNSLSISDFEKNLVSEGENDVKKTLNSHPVKVVLEGTQIEKPYDFFVKVFGTQRKRGEVVFFDAYPEDFNKNCFEIDIMNPHYQKYYTEKGKEPPADWYNPVPIHFLTLKEGLVFVVCLGEASLDEGLEDKEWKLIETLLKVGLENFGVGAKKRKGYGWFEIQSK
ncbi:CRISPR-associated Cmr6 family protein [Hydrogenivirga caldilitoris]|uniref:CRISPR-associated Cmr6 family protein n=1 Tax=Hydrogenivirga caldilitoris TaxID=246264 RepID=A0A497XU77_9AQUI|nr:type III-B CRISPR module RAMP protein Cmr6 [Hydrogenivirga caldilitoris]RLJ70692.1 CRISPR-associated Cmr6 family protein [Hydrogenivirga caldilitoris]